MKFAALGACPKCGYGFAGKKPTPKGMVKLDPTDPKYDPTKPCPNCEMGLEDTSSSHKEDTGAGQEWYIALAGNPEEKFQYALGPFPDKDHAEGRRTQYLDVRSEFHAIRGKRKYPDNKISKDQILEDYETNGSYPVVSPMKFQEASKDRKINVIPFKKELGDFLEDIEILKKDDKEKRTKELIERKPANPNVASVRRRARLPSDIDLEIDDDSEIAAEDDLLDEALARLEEQTTRMRKRRNKIEDPYDMTKPLDLDEILKRKGIAHARIAVKYALSCYSKGKSKRG